MAQLELKAMIDSLTEMDLSDLRSLKSHVDLVVKIRSQSEISTDLETPSMRSEESGLAESARRLLQQGIEDQRWTLADQALLAKETRHGNLNAPVNCYCHKEHFIRTMS